MADRISDAEVAQLKDEWTLRFESFLSDTVLTAKELRELAAHGRELAEQSEFAGQRRGFLRAAERLERAAVDRAGVGG